MVDTKPCWAGNDRWACGQGNDSNFPRYPNNSGTMHRLQTHHCVVLLIVKFV